MKNLLLNDYSRCAGRITWEDDGICEKRKTCKRYLQIEIDRVNGLDYKLNNISVILNCKDFEGYIECQTIIQTDTD